MATFYAECVQGELREKPLAGVTIWLHPKASLYAIEAKTDSSGKAQLVAPNYVFMGDNIWAEAEGLETQTAVAWGDIVHRKFVWKEPKREGDKAGRGEEFTAAGLITDLVGEPDIPMILLVLAFLIGLAVLAWGIRPYAKIAAKVA